MYLILCMNKCIMIQSNCLHNHCFCSVCLLFSEAVDGCFYSEQLFSEEGGSLSFSSSLLRLGFHHRFSPARLRQWSSSWDPHGVYLAHEKETCFSILIIFTFCCIYQVHEKRANIYKRMQWYYILCEADLSENCLKDMKAGKAVIEHQGEIHFISFSKNSWLFFLSEIFTLKHYHNITFVMFFSWICCCTAYIMYKSYLKYVFTIAFYLCSFINAINFKPIE